MNKELKIADDIENIVLKIVGRDMIIWENTVNILNKVLLLLVFAIFARRSDYLTVNINHANYIIAFVNFRSLWNGV